MSIAAMWTSKLGNKYPKAWMQENDKASQQELKRLRSLSGNKTCADCDRQDNSWASVSHGVFICVICSDVHRSVGTHITKVKGCTGTYLWGPDELERMQSAGNQAGNSKYGAKKIQPDASKEQKQRYVNEKYVTLSFVNERPPAPYLAHTSSGAEVVTATRPTAIVRNATAAEMRPPQRSAQKTVAIPIACSANISDSWLDDFFKEDACCAKSAGLLKVNEVPIVECTEPPYETTKSLDDFLDAALHAEAKPAPASITACPASLDPFQKVHPAPATDPFFDWPEL